MYSLYSFFHNLESGKDDRLYRIEDPLIVQPVLLRSFFRCVYNTRIRFTVIDCRVAAMFGSIGSAGIKKFLFCFVYALLGSLTPVSTKVSGPRSSSFPRGRMFSFGIIC